MDMKEKTRENRLRRKLSRMGYKLKKNRRRDPQAIDYGGYMIVNTLTNTIDGGGYGINPYSMNIDDVEKFVKE